MKPAPEPEVPVGAGAAPGLEPDVESQRTPPKYKWYHKLAGLFAVIFCFELGVFLLVFPFR